jgi:hypothetical protein
VFSCESCRINSQFGENLKLGLAECLARYYTSHSDMILNTCSLEKILADFGSKKSLTVKFSICCLYKQVVDPDVDPAKNLDNKRK